MEWPNDEILSGIYVCGGMLAEIYACGRLSYSTLYSSKAKPFPLLHFEPGGGMIYLRND